MRISDWSSDVCSSDLQHAQLVGDLGVGGIDRLVLADDAADLGGEVAGALLQHRIVEHLAWLDSECRRSQQQQQDEKQAPHDPRASTSGFTSRSITSGPRAPRWCTRMPPPPPMIKVHGPPVTPPP